MVVSAFCFLNELDLLEYRLHTMAPMVDLFVLLESPVTFSGKPKPLHFHDNRERFAQWPIHHVIVGEREGDEIWKREAFQRKTLYEAVEKLQPEIAIFSDTDEIVRPDTVERFRATDHQMMRLELDMISYYIDREDELEWIQGCILRWRDGIVPELRGGHSPILRDAGWHFWGIGQGAAMSKSLSTSHADEPGGRDFREKLERGELPGLERTSPYPIGLLPLPMQSDISKLREKGWLHP